MPPLALHGETDTSSDDDLENGQLQMTRKVQDLPDHFGAHSDSSDDSDVEELNNHKEVAKNDNAAGTTRSGRQFRSDPIDSHQKETRPYTKRPIIKIEIPLPNEQARLEILKIHAGLIAKHGEIDYEAVVKLSDGFNGADLRNVCTESGLFAIRAEREYVIQEDFMKAVRKVSDNKKLESSSTTNQYKSP
ncbi:hypothetical protein B566_EDAN003804 [Ephemera danica]|nr:hypothetical protein B566_EDAN003804 [Ephemera danica]